MTTERLPVFKTAVAANVLLWQNRWLVTKLLLISIFFTSISSAAFFLQLHQVASGRIVNQQIFEMSIYVVTPIVYVMYFAFAYILFKACMLGESELSLRRRQNAPSFVKFSLRALVFAIFVYLLVLPIVMVAMILLGYYDVMFPPGGDGLTEGVVAFALATQLIFMLAVGLLAVRWLMMLPLRMLGHKQPMKASAKLPTLRAAVATVVALLPGLLIYGLWLLMNYSIMRQIDPMLYQANPELAIANYAHNVLLNWPLQAFSTVFGAIATFAVMALGVHALSVCAIYMRRRFPEVCEPEQWEQAVVKS